MIYEKIVLEKIIEVEVKLFIIIIPIENQTREPKNTQTFVYFSEIAFFNKHIN